MNQDGTNTSLFGISITAFLTIISQVALNDMLTACAIIAALTTAALNIKNYLKKDKK